MTERAIKYTPLAALKAHPDNPKSHALDTLGASVARFGYVEPIVVDERTGYLISGHGRTEALRAAEAAFPGSGEPVPDGIQIGEGGAWMVPVMTGWASKSDTEARAALIALNRTGEIGGWNDEALLTLLDDLDGVAGFGGIGFGADDLDDLRARLQEIEPEPDRDPGNTRETPSMTDYRERYEEQGRRLIVLDYDHAEYPLVTARLKALREETGTESNADAIHVYLGQVYPDVRPEEPRQPGDQADYTDPDPENGTPA